MQVDKGALLKAVKQVMPGVATGAKVLEGSDTIIFSKKGLHSFNREISVTVPFDFNDEIEGTLDATDLYNILNNKRLKVISDAIELEQVSNGVKFSGNGWSGILEFRENAEWMHDKIKALSDVVCGNELPTDFMKGLGLCSIKGNPLAQHGVYVVGTGMYSTDKRIANIYSMDSECEEFWIGQDEVNEFLKVPGSFTHYELTSTTMGHWVHFKDTEGTLFSMALKDCSLYKNALAFLKNQEDIAPVDKKLQGKLPTGFADAVNTCAMMAEKRDGKKSVQLAFTSKKMVVKGIKSGGKLTNDLPWDEGTEMDLGNEKLKYQFVSTNIVTASRKAKNFFINKMNDAEDSCMIVLYDDDFRAILLSMKS